MSPATGLRAGLIGLGAMGRNHARVLHALDGVELVGVLDPAPGAVAPFGVPVVGDLEQLLALRLDYAVIACPTALHEEIGLTPGQVELVGATGVVALAFQPARIGLQKLASRALYGERFVHDPPARATVEAAGLPRGALVEIDAIAVIA